MIAIKLSAILLLVLSQVLDWHSTLAFLKSGKGFEANARMAWLQRKFGPSRAMILKGLAHLPLAVALWLLPYLLIYARIIAKNYRIARP